MNLLGNLFGFPSNDDGTATVTTPAFSKGFAGELNVKSALVFEDDKIILAVEYDFEEAPLYIDFDLDNYHIQIVQQTGDVATLAQTTIPAEEMDNIRKARSIALVSGIGQDKLLQVLKLRLRGQAAKIEAA